jgi:hypothetical protein
MRLALGQGSYSIAVVDASGCSDTVMAVVDTVNQLSFQLTGTDPTCNLTNGIVEVNTLSGQPPFTYTWNAGALPDTSYVDGLSAGSYSLSVTDANSCVQTDNINLSTDLD